MNARERRAMQLVEAGNVEKKNLVYVVRSQTDKNQNYAVRFKTDAAMKAEVHCKFIAHNLTCLIQEQATLGIAPIFLQDERSNAIQSTATNYIAKI